MVVDTRTLLLAAGVVTVAGIGFVIWKHGQPAAATTTNQQNQNQGTTQNGQLPPATTSPPSSHLPQYVVKVDAYVTDAPGSTSHVVDVIRAGTFVSVIDTTAGLSHVRYATSLGGPPKTGYVTFSSLKQAAPTPKGGLVKCSLPECRLYNSQIDFLGGTNGYRTALPTTIFTVLDDDPGQQYLRVQGFFGSDNITGFIARSDVVPTSAAAAQSLVSTGATLRVSRTTNAIGRTISADGRVWVAPDVRSFNVPLLQRNDAIEIVETAGQWTHIRHGVGTFAIEGWIPSAYIAVTRRPFVASIGRYKPLRLRAS